MTKKRADRPRWYRITLRHALVAALGTGAGAAAVFGGVVMLLAGHSIRPQADNCGLITCSANVPTAPRPSPSPTPEAPRHHARVLHHRRHDPPPASPLATSPSPSPSPTPTPARTRPHPKPSATPSPPAVTVGYSLVQQWPGGFQGEFTIVNHGTTTLSGWVLAVTFPGDQIDSAWDASYQTDGDTLTLTPAPYLPPIPPGGSQSAFFTANGTQQTPTSCTLNGKACG